MQKARRHALPGAPTACRQTGSGSLSLPCSGFFSPFPHGTCPLSVSWEYLALRDGPRRSPPILAGFLVSRDTQDPPESHQAFVYRAFTVCGRPSQGVPLRSTLSLLVALLPRPCLDNAGLGYSAFARHYLRNHFCFLFLRVLRCFSSPRSLPFRDGRPSACRVPPFGHPGINGCLRLRPAFRSLPRPSSPPGAKASTVCPSLAS